MKPASILIACSVSLLGVGCIEVARRPLAPERGEAAFRERGLDAPELAVLAEPGRPWPPAELRLADLVRVGWLLAPELAGARARLEAARGEVEGARAKPNPTLALTPTRVGHTSGSPWVFTAVLDQLLDVSGRRRRAAELAEQDAVLAELELGERAWERYRVVRDAAVALRLSREEAELARNEVQLAEGELDLAQARFDAGDSGRDVLLVARARREAAERALAERSREVELARTHLAGAIGLPAEALEGRRIHLTRLAASKPLEASASDRLDLRRGLAEYERAERVLRLELARQWPDLRLGPGFEYDQGARKWSLGFAFDLPILNRNAGPIHAAEARREAARDRFLALQAAALAEQADARAAVEAARARLAALDSAEATQDERETTGRAALEAGAAGRGDVLALARDRLELDREQLRAERALQAALARFEDATQRPLDPSLAVPKESDDA